RKGEPDAAPREGLLHRDLMRVALEHAEVEREHRSDEGKKRAPRPQGHGFKECERQHHRGAAWRGRRAAGKRGVGRWNRGGIFYLAASTRPKARCTAARSASASAPALRSTKRSSSVNSFIRTTEA